MLASMHQAGLVDPDIFISQGNELASRLQAAKREKERLIGARDDKIPAQTRALLEELDSMPDFLPAFDGEIFSDLIEKITVEYSGMLQFYLKNGLRLTEPLKGRE